MKRHIIRTVNTYKKHLGASRGLVLAAALFFGFGSSLLASNSQAGKGELPIPGSNSTSEYLTLDQHGTLLENDEVSLVWEKNGDLKLYYYETEVIWSSNTGGKGNLLVFQDSDGQLLIKDQSGKAIWSNNTSGGAILEVHADKDMVMLDGSNKVIWETGTALETLSTSGTHTISASVEAPQDFIIPVNVSYKYIYFHAEGADGGKKQVKEAWGSTRFTVNGGEGATIKSAFEIGTGENMIPPGSTVRVIVGKKGSTRTGQTTAGSSGGAGTAVLVKKPGNADWHLMMVAGGGGGAYSDCCTDKQSGKPAEIEESGSDGGGKNGGAGGSSGNYGKNGSRTGTVGIGSGGGGAFQQYVVNTTNASIAGDPGWPGGRNNPSKLPLGGDGGYADYGVSGSWGFGGSGGGGPSGGGGGGYSGGGSGAAFQEGGGGGSYLNTAYAVPGMFSKIKNGTTSSTKDGYVTYQFIEDPNIEINGFSFNNGKLSVNGSSSSELMCQVVVTEPLRFSYMISAAQLPNTNLPANSEIELAFHDKNVSASFFSKSYSAYFLNNGHAMAVSRDMVTPERIGGGSVNWKAEIEHYTNSTLEFKLFVKYPGSSQYEYVETNNTGKFVLDPGSDCRVEIALQESPGKHIKPVTFSVPGGF